MSEKLRICKDTTACITPLTIIETVIMSTFLICVVILGFWRVYFYDDLNQFVVQGLMGAGGRQPQMYDREGNPLAPPPLRG